MLKIFSLVVLFANLSAIASPGPFMIASKCIIAANQQLMDFGMGYDPDGAPLYLDSNGKTVVQNQSNIVKRTLENGVETITYKTKTPKFEIQSMGKPTEFETVERTIVISRDGSGRLTKIAKHQDTASQIKIQKNLAKSGIHGFPILKSSETEFTYSGDECSLNQSLGLEMENEKSKIEKKVYYDKKFCDQLAPTVKQMGLQNASQCAGLIGQAQMAFEARNEELKKEGKSMKELNPFGKSSSRAIYDSNVFNIGMVIQSCALADEMVWGTGVGMAAPMGFGMRGMSGGGGGLIGKPVKVEETKSAR